MIRKQDASRSYRSDPKDPHSLSIDIVLAIFEDRAGILWLGTLEGLNRFDPKTEQFTVYRPDPRKPGTLGNRKVNAILEDRHGTLWVGTQRGLNQMDRSRGTFTNLTKKDGLPDNAIKAIRGRSPWVISGWPRKMASVDLTQRPRRFATIQSRMVCRPIILSPYGAEGSFQNESGEIVFGSTQWRDDISPGSALR